MKSFETLVGKTTRAAIADDRQIKQVISRIVPARTLAHIEFCRVEGGRLRITVDSAAWISRIRFLECQIIDHLREHRFDSHTISYHVSPEILPVGRSTARLIASEKDGANTERSATANSSERNERLRLESRRIVGLLLADKR